MDSIRKYVKIIDLHESISRLVRNISVRVDQTNHKDYSLIIPDDPITVSTRDKNNEPCEVIAKPEISKMLPEKDLVAVLVVYAIEDTKDTVGLILGKDLKRTASLVIKERLNDAGFSQDAVDDFTKNIKNTLLKPLKGNKYLFEIESTSMIAKNELERAIRYKISMDELA